MRDGSSWQVTRCRTPCRRIRRRHWSQPASGGGGMRGQCVTGCRGDPIDVPRVAIPPSRLFCVASPPTNRPAGAGRPLSTSCGACCRPSVGERWRGCPGVVGGTGGGDGRATSPLPRATSASVRDRVRTEPPRCGGELLIGRRIHAAARGCPHGPRLPVCGLRRALSRSCLVSVHLSGPARSSSTLVGNDHLGLDRVITSSTRAASSVTAWRAGRKYVRESTSFGSAFSTSRTVVVKTDTR